MIFGRTIRTTLDLLKPQVETQILKQQSRSIHNHDKTAREREFAVGQPVFALQYLGPRKLVGDVISRRTGPLSYDVQVGDQSTHLNSSRSSKSPILVGSTARTALRRRRGTT